MFRELVVAEMKIQGAIGPKNGVRKAAQKSVALTMAFPVRVVMVAAASYFRKAGPRKVMRKRFNNVLGHVCASAEWDVVAKRDICRPSFWGLKFGPQNGDLVTIFS